MEKLQYYNLQAEEDINELASLTLNRLGRFSVRKALLPLRWLPKFVIERFRAVNRSTNPIIIINSKYFPVSE